METQTLKKKRIHISFHMHPYKFEDGAHVVEKTNEKGNKRKYLLGISSGLKTDGHEERMTKNCINYMFKQAKSGSILLYEGQHGVTYTDDLGILTDSEITDNGDWLTTYRLYDENDNFEKGSRTLERADKLWRQVNGLPPYVDEEGNPRPLQKGFSIEGYIPDGGILAMSETGQRLIDKVDIDGTLVTPRPAYTDSVITAVYKALDELTPQKKEIIQKNIRGKFYEKIEDENRKQSYFSKRFKLEDALNESIEEIMKHGNQLRDKLELLFDEYKAMMIDLLVSHSTIFSSPEDSADIPDETGAIVAKMQRVQLLKSIEGQLRGFLDMRSHVTKSKEIRNYGKRSKRFKSRGKTYN